jgi:hypothetical protein
METKNPLLGIKDKKKYKSLEPLFHIMKYHINSAITFFSFHLLMPLERWPVISFSRLLSSLLLIIFIFSSRLAIFALLLPLLFHLPVTKGKSSLLQTAPFFANRIIYDQ